MTPNKKDWGEKYLAILRKALNTPEIEELREMRDQAKQAKNEFANQLKNIDHQLTDLEVEHERILSESKNLETIDSSLDQDIKIVKKIQILETVRAKIGVEGPKRDQHLAICEKNLTVAVKRILRIVRNHEQESLNKELRKISDRINSHRKSAQEAVNEIQARTDYYFVGSKSDLDISQLLKDLRY